MFHQRDQGHDQSAVRWGHIQSGVSDVEQTWYMVDVVQWHIVCVTRSSWSEQYICIVCILGLYIYKWCILAVQSPGVVHSHPCSALQLEKLEPSCFLLSSLFQICLHFFAVVVISIFPTWDFFLSVRNGLLTVASIVQNEVTWIDYHVAYFLEGVEW